MLDADLQHPPARIPAMLAEARAAGADVVVASRSAPGGSGGGLETVREVPYRFEPRHLGDSKADLRQGLRFLHHLRTLVWDCSPALAWARLASPSSGAPYGEVA